MSVTSLRATARSRWNRCSNSEDSSRSFSSLVRSASSSAMVSLEPSSSAMSCFTPFTMLVRAVFMDCRAARSPMLAGCLSCPKMASRSSVMPLRRSISALRVGSGISPASEPRRLDTPMTGRSRPRWSLMSRRLSAMMDFHLRMFLSVFVTATMTPPTVSLASRRMSISGAVIGLEASHTMRRTPAFRASRRADFTACWSRPPTPGVSTRVMPARLSQRKVISAALGSSASRFPLAWVPA